ncbi:MAG: hypothetical protein HC892_03635 [Saprospiraceae bacterium]|nr:hypothetical protein [Saprospiraceae bacterium]
MKTRILIFATLFVIATLSSCNMDEQFDQEMNNAQAENLDAKATPQTTSPTAMMENVETFLKESAKPEIEITDSTAFEDKTAHKIQLEIKKDSELETRGGFLSCGNSIYSSTYGKGNTVHNGIYQNFGLHANLDGQDDIFVIEINSYTTADFILSNTSRNLGWCFSKVTEIVAVGLVNTLFNS